MENLIPTKDGVHVTHGRAKQRSDKRETAFKVHNGEGDLKYADILVDYLNKLKADTSKVCIKIS